MFSCIFSCEEDSALSIIDPMSALVELNNARRPTARRTAGLLDIAGERLPSVEVRLKHILGTITLYWFHTCSVVHVCEVSTVVRSLTANQEVSGSFPGLVRKLNFGRPSFATPSVDMDG